MSTVTFQAGLDEFEIRARSADGTERVWTRTKLDVSKHIAENAVNKLGFVSAQVFVQGNALPLYIVVDEEKR